MLVMPSQPGMLAIDCIAACTGTAACGNEQAYATSANCWNSSAHSASSAMRRRVRRAKCGRRCMFRMLTQDETVCCKVARKSLKLGALCDLIRAEVQLVSLRQAQDRPFSPGEKVARRAG